MNGPRGPIDAGTDPEVLAAVVCCWQLFVAASVICGVEDSWEAFKMVDSLESRSIYVGLHLQMYFPIHYI